MTNTNLPAGRRIDLEHQYGCAASMTIAYFVVCGVAHVARRLLRSDLQTTGKIEIYTVAPDRTRQADGAPYVSASAEDWLRYADEFEPSRTDIAAMNAIAAVEGSGYAPAGLVIGQMARVAALELR